MKVSNLLPNYYLFGNKGNLHNNEAHIARDIAITTLCGTPMLSTNHCKINNVETIGCKKCIKVYNAEVVYSAEVLLHDYNKMLEEIKVLSSACVILLNKAKNLTFQITLDNLDELTIYKTKGIIYLQNEHGSYLAIDDLSFGELTLIYQNLQK